MPGTGSAPDRSPDSPDDINNRLAEIAAELAAEAKFKEPSAAERARAAARAARHSRSGPGTGTGPLSWWRNKRAAAKLRRPVQQRDGSAAQAAAPRARKPAAARRAAQSAGGPAPDRGYGTATQRPGHGRSILALIIVIALLFGVSVGLRKLLHSGTSAPGAAPSSSNRVATGNPTPSLSVATPLFTAADPFAGSPAASFADGAAGIVLPTARAHGQFTAAQVAAAYQVVKGLLIAGNLNWPTLRGNKPRAFGNRLIPQQHQWFYGNLARTGLTTKGVARTSRLWVTSFARGTTQFVGTVIKVHGLPMSAAAVHSQGRIVLRIFADYLFVYAVEQPGVPASRMRVVARMEYTVDFAQWNDPGGQLEPWAFMVNSSDAGGQCGVTDGYVDPEFPQSSAGSVAPTGKPVNPYDLSIPQRTGSCQRTTGT
jgi:hypothetical protein